MFQFYFSVPYFAGLTPGCLGLEFTSNRGMGVHPSMGVYSCLRKGSGRLFLPIFAILRPWKLGENHSKTSEKFWNQRANCKLASGFSVLIHQNRLLWSSYRAYCMLETFIVCPHTKINHFPSLKLRVQRNPGIVHTQLWRNPPCCIVSSSGIARCAHVRVSQQIFGGRYEYDISDPYL